MLKFAQSLASFKTELPIIHPLILFHSLSLIDIFGVSASLIMKLKIKTILCYSSVDSAGYRSLEMMQLCENKIRN